MLSVQVALLPKLITESLSPDHVAVMIDILRASTTIIHALDAGATEIIPFESVEQAIAYRQSHAEENLVLGGERHCQLIPGFDLGNSPLSYTPEVIGGRSVVFTTTNGTSALQHCRAAGRVLVGGFANQSAIANALIQLDCSVQLVCAGTDGELTGEDIAFAGSLVDSLMARQAIDDSQLDLQAQLAADFFRHRCVNNQSLCETVFESRGAARLLELGWQADVERAIEIDRSTIVPLWSAETNTITTLSDRA